MQKMRVFAAFPLLTLALLTAACAGPRAPVMPRAEAAKDTRVMRLEVLKVYDNSQGDYTTEFHVGYVVEVEVLDGPADYKGRVLDLPYDDYYVGRHPPLVGDVVTVTPADWVTQREPGKTRGFGE